MECPALALLHWLHRGENTKGSGQNWMWQPQADAFSNIRLSETRPPLLCVFTHGHFENIALIATIPNRCLHLIQWFPGVQQLNEYKRDSLILSKSMEEGKATPAPPPPSIPFWDNSSISLALAATMPYSSLCQWNNTASVAMDRAQQQLRAYADIAACEADASVFAHANYASFFFNFKTGTVHVSEQVQAPPFAGWCSDDGKGTKTRGRRKRSGAELLHWNGKEDSRWDDSHRLHDPIVGN